MRRDYRPGTGPVRGLLHALPLAVVLWVLLAAIAVVIR